ncbi:hypothetical protein HY409_00870 [Candidatus Gottesmanbacteria bacterium]|nr:hypothetical protein [Candidatus Gottesmanbacteria bacterium]
MSETLSLVQQKYDSLIYQTRSFIDDFRLEMEYRSKKEMSDWELFFRTDPYLAHEMGHECFLMLQKKMKGADDEVIDLGSGRNLLRGLIFLNAKKIIGIDPGYEWYESTDDRYSLVPELSNVFGGVGEKQDMVRLLKRACKNLAIPQRIEDSGVHEISGIRNGQRREFQLHPVDAGQWIDDQVENSIPNIIVWRTFVPADIWGKIITSLKIGGYLITTGYGKIYPRSKIELFRDFDSITCGVDVDDSPVPVNGNTQSVGLESLTLLPNMYFYQKTKQIDSKVIREEVLRNK